MKAFSLRLLTSACAVLLTTTSLHAVQIPPQKPTSPDAGKPVQLEAPLKFLVLQGVDRLAGRFNKPMMVTVNRMVPEQRTRTVTVQRNGVTTNVPQSYTIMVPQSYTVSLSLEAKTHNVYDGDGKLIPSYRVFDRLKDGQLVIISSKPTLSKEYLKLLSSKAVIIAPKPKPEASR